MERVGGRKGKIEGHYSTGQSPQWAVVPMEEEEDTKILSSIIAYRCFHLTVIYRVLYEVYHFHRINILRNSHDV